MTQSDPPPDAAPSPSDGGRPKARAVQSRVILALAAVGGLALIALLVSGVAALRDEPLAERDPAGAEACDRLAFALERENAGVFIGSMLAAGKAADLADTVAIRESVTDYLEGVELPPGADRDAALLPDVKKLRDACIDEGVDMPPSRDQDD